MEREVIGSTMIVIFIIGAFWMVMTFCLPFFVYRIRREMIQLNKFMTALILLHGGEVEGYEQVPKDQIKLKLS